MLARELVEDPSGVSVTEWTEGDMTHLDLEVAASDRRRAPGRPGGRGAAPRNAVRRGDPGLMAQAFADMVTIGRIVRPQGRKGEVVVQSLSDRPDRFPTLRQA